jgi:hypothetical protein
VTEDAGLGSAPLQHPRPAQAAGPGTGLSGSEPLQPPGASCTSTIMSTIDNLVQKNTTWYTISLLFMLLWQPFPSGLPQLEIVRLTVALGQNHSACKHEGLRTPTAKSWGQTGDRQPQREVEAHVVSRAPLKAPLATKSSSTAGHASERMRRCFTASAATAAVGWNPAPHCGCSSTPSSVHNNASCQLSSIHGDRAGLNNVRLTQGPRW